jgi:hypothetical protein
VKPPPPWHPAIEAAHEAIRLAEQLAIVALLQSAPSPTVTAHLRRILLTARGMRACRRASRSSLPKRSASHD